MPLEILQRILGHSNITTTMRNAHVGAWEADQAINLICAKVSPKKGEPKKVDG